MLTIPTFTKLTSFLFFLFFSEIKHHVCNLLLFKNLCCFFLLYIFLNKRQAASFCVTLHSLFLFAPMYVFFCMFYMLAFFLYDDISSCMKRVNCIIFYDGNKKNDTSAKEIIIIILPPLSWRFFFLFFGCKTIFLLHFLKKE